MLLVGKSHGNSQGNACQATSFILLSPTQVHQWLPQPPFLFSGHTVLQTHSPLQGMQLNLDASLHLEAVYEQACHML